MQIKKRFRIREKLEGWGDVYFRGRIVGSLDTQDTTGKDSLVFVALDAYSQHLFDSEYAAFHFNFLHGLTLPDSEEDRTRLEQRRERLEKWIQYINLLKQNHYLQRSLNISRRAAARIDKILQRETDGVVMASDLRASATDQIEHDFWKNRPGVLHVRFSLNSYCHPVKLCIRYSGVEDSDISPDYVFNYDSPKMYGFYKPYEFYLDVNRKQDAYLSGRHHSMPQQFGLKLQMSVGRSKTYLFLPLRELNKGKLEVIE